MNRVLEFASARSERAAIKFCDRLANVTPRSWMRKIDARRRAHLVDPQFNAGLIEATGSALPDSPDRKALIERVCERWQGGAILDFGSGAGAIAKIIQARTGAELWLVDATQELLDHADVPNANIIHADDVEFCKMELPRFGLIYVRGVFCVMSEERVRAVLRHMVNLCDEIIICEPMGAAFTSHPSIYRRKIIHHTYGNIFRDLGWTVSDVLHTGAPLGLLTARPSQP